MAATVLGAIVSRYDASGISTVGAGGLWVGEIPEEKFLPFVVLMHEGEIADFDTFERFYKEVATVKFEVFAVGLAIAEGIAAQIKTLFDLPGTADATAALKIDNGFVAACVRKDYLVSATTLRDASQNLVYNVSMGYEIWTQRTL